MNVDRDVRAGTLKAAFVLLSNPAAPAPSTRIAVLNILPALQTLGIESQIAFAPPSPQEAPELPDLVAAMLERGVQVVVFQKVRGPSVLRTAVELERHGIRTVYMVCDFVEPDLVQAMSATVVVTGFLRSLYPTRLHHKIHVIHDGIEQPEAVTSALHWPVRAQSKPLDLALVTAQTLDRVPVLGSTLPYWAKLNIVGRYPSESSIVNKLRALRWSAASRPGTSWTRQNLAFLIDPRLRCSPWTSDGVYRHLAAADVGIIPVDRDDSGPLAAPGVPSWKVRSENRLVLKMAMGLPVVATPIPAYEDVINDGVNGFLAESTKEWQESLRVLRDPARRREMGSRARADVLDRYSRDRQAKLLNGLLRNLVGETLPIGNGDRSLDRASGSHEER